MKKEIIKMSLVLVLSAIIVGYFFIPDEIHAEERRDSVTIEHVVKPGECFYSIAERIIEEYNLDCSAMGLQFCIKAQNDWKGDPRTLQPGTLLKITIEK